MTEKITITIEYRGNTYRALYRALAELRINQAKGWDYEGRADFLDGRVTWTHSKT